MKKGKNKKSGKKYHLEFSGSSIFFWSLALFFLMGWIFVLGILVGRGFLNERMENISELKNSIAKLQRMVKDKESTRKEPEKKPEKEPQFAFYKELVDDKEEKTDPKKQGREQNIGAKREKADRSKYNAENKKPKSEPPKPSGQEPSTPAKPENRGAEEMKPSQGSSPEVRSKTRNIGPFSVQIASLGTQSQADKLVEKLERRGYPVFIKKVQIGGKTYFRVHCGPFNKRQEALSFKSMFAAKEKMEGIIAKHPVSKKTASSPESSTRTAEKVSKRGSFTVQIASLNSVDEAEKMVRRFESLGYPVYYYKTTIKGRTRFRVRCGAFNTRKEAEAFREKLAKKEFVVGFVTPTDK